MIKQVEQLLSELKRRKILQKVEIRCSLKQIRQQIKKFYRQMLWVEQVKGIQDLFFQLDNESMSVMQEEIPQLDKSNLTDLKRCYGHLEDLSVQLCLVSEKIQKFLGIQFFDQEKVISGISDKVQKLEPQVIGQMELISQLINRLSVEDSKAKGEVKKQFALFDQEISRIMQQPAEDYANNFHIVDNQQFCQ